MSENVKIENKKTEGKDLTAEIKNLVVEFRTDYGVVQALNGLDLEIGRGKTLGLVGETGAGKTTAGLSLLRLIPDPPGVIVDGSIKLDGQDILSMSEKEMQDIRGKKVAMIFQDPMTSLDPVMTVEEQIAEGIKLHEKPAPVLRWNEAARGHRHGACVQPGASDRGRADDGPGRDDPGAGAGDDEGPA